MEILGMDRKELADRLERFSTSLRLDARQALREPRDPSNLYLFSVWPLSPEEHSALLTAARSLKATTAETALNLATAYGNRLVWFANATKSCPDLSTLAEEAAGVMEDVSHTLCPALDSVVAELRVEPAKKTRRRRAGQPQRPRPLTARQAEVIQIVGECKGNVAEAAIRLGRDRKTIDESYRAGMAKLGKNVCRKKKTGRLIPRDKRGQADVADIDDQRRDSDDEQSRKYRRG